MDEQEKIIRMQLEYWHRALITLDKNESSYEEKVVKCKEEIKKLRRQYALFKIAEMNKQEKGR